MIQVKLLVDSYLKFSRPASRRLPKDAFVPAFVDVVCPGMTIKKSSRRSYNPFSDVTGRESRIVAGENTAKPHRNFKWLPWYAGDISKPI